ncbi:cyclin [Hamiltosporidium tvaerminnensis]|nr:cyclin [Hamiltosporidium tvaerminnensis]
MPLRNITNRKKEAKKYKDTSNLNFSETEDAIYRLRELDDSRDVTMYYEYAEMVFIFFKKLETEYLLKNNFMNIQKEIGWSERCLLVDWIIEVHWKLGLVPETLYHTVYIMDKLLSLRVVSTEKLQLLGITCLLISSKYEEVVCPSIETFVILSEKTISEEEIRKAERYVLSVLDFQLNYPSPLNFLRKCSKANNYEYKTRMVAKYLMELTFFYPQFRSISGSLVSASSMFLSRKILEMNENENIFFFYSGYSKKDVQSCANEIFSIILQPIMYENVQKKYSSSKMLKVSNFIKDFSKEYLKNSNINSIKLL